MDFVSRAFREFLRLISKFLNNKYINSSFAISLNLRISSLSRDMPGAHLVRDFLIVLLWDSGSAVQTKDPAGLHNLARLIPNHKLKNIRFSQNTVLNFLGRT